MPRTLSLAATRSLTAPESAEIWLVLLTIEADGLAEPIRVVNDRLPLLSRGSEYVAYPFEIELPADDPESVPRVVLRIDNVDRAIVLALRAVAAPPSVTIEVVRRAAPDEVEAGPFKMTLAEARYSAEAVEAELVFEDVLNLAFPGGVYTPADYPGLF